MIFFWGGGLRIWRFCVCYGTLFHLFFVLYATFFILDYLVVVILACYFGLLFSLCFVICVLYFLSLWLFSSHHLLVWVTVSSSGRLSYPAGSMCAGVRVSAGVLFLRRTFFIFLFFECSYVAESAKKLELIEMDENGRAVGMQKPVREP